MRRVPLAAVALLTVVGTAGCDPGPLSSNIALATIDGRSVVVIKTCGDDVSRLAFREGGNRNGRIVESVSVGSSGRDVEYVDVTDVGVVRDASSADGTPMFVIDLIDNKGFAGDQLIYEIPPEGLVTFRDVEVVVEPLSSFLSRPPGCGPSPSASASDGLE